MNGWFIEEWEFDSGQGRQNFLFSIDISTRNISCFKSNKTLYDCYATVLLNVYIYLVFVGEGYLALVPSLLPHLRLLHLLGCYNVCDEYLKELVAAVPELKVFDCEGIIVSNQHLETGELL